MVLNKSRGDYWGFWTVGTRSHRLSNRTNELKVSKSWRSHRLGDWLSVRSAALLSLTLQRVMSQCWLQLPNGAFYTKWLTFPVKIYSKAFPLAQFCCIFTKQSIISDSSSRTAKDGTVLQIWPRSRIQRYTAQQSAAPLFFLHGAWIQSFIHSLDASHLIYCLKRKGKLFSCLIRMLINCQKWILDCVPDSTWPCERTGRWSSFEKGLCMIILGLCKCLWRQGWHRCVF